MGRVFCRVCPEISSHHFTLVFNADKPEIKSFCPAGTKNCPAEKVVTESDSVILTCQVSAYPEADVSWFYLGSDPANPGTPLDIRADRMFDFHDGRLLINNLKRNDTGFYKCYASNSLGQDDVVMHLLVKGKKNRGLNIKFSPQVYT